MRNNRNIRRKNDKVRELDEQGISEICIGLECQSKDYVKLVEDIEEENLNSSLKTTQYSTSL